MADKNPFGGGNRHSLYTPMSDVEQEVLDRLLSAGELVLEIKDWGVVDTLPGASMGDLRLSIPFQMNFTRPEFPQSVYFFDMVLKTRTGITLHAERMPTLYNGKPILVAAGMTMSMVWDIAIREMDPKFVKLVKPGAIGLTSENFDKDTGNATVFGNRKVSTRTKNLLLRLRQFEAASRQDDRVKLTKAEKKAGLK